MEIIEYDTRFTTSYYRLEDENGDPLPSPVAIGKRVQTGQYIGLNWFLCLHLKNRTLKL
jgi:hypothetical protein